MQGAMKLIFVAAPSRAIAVNGKVQDFFIKKVAELNDTNPGFVFISPMIHDYPVSEFMQDEPTWENWRKRCLTVLRVCDAMVVVTYDDWMEAQGVIGEIEFAKEHLKAVFYVQPEKTLRLTQR